MSYADFLHAMTPYNHCDLKNTSEEYLKKFTPKLLSFADVDGSGEIDFSEFFFFLTMLQIPSGVLRKAFRKGSKPGFLTVEELCEQLP